MAPTQLQQREPSPIPDIAISEGSNLDADLGDIDAMLADLDKPATPNLTRPVRGAPSEQKPLELEDTVEGPGSDSLGIDQLLTGLDGELNADDAALAAESRTKPAPGGLGLGGLGDSGLAATDDAFDLESLDRLLDVIGEVDIGDDF